MNQEQIIKIQLMEHEVNTLNNQIQLIDQNILELRELMLSLNEIVNDKELFIDLGKRIYAPVKIKDNKLLVEVGKGNFVKKNVSESKKVVNEQAEKLDKARTQILERLNDLHNEMNNIIIEIEKEQKGKG